MARAISFDRPVAVVPAGGTADAAVFACTGSPVDCVRVGLLSGLLEPVDLVVSGINHGLNVGDDTTYSGTVGAALEAAMLACRRSRSPSRARTAASGSTTACSRSRSASPRRPHGSRARSPTRPPPRTVLNVNLPHGDGTPPIALTRPGRRFFTADVVKSAGGPGEARTYYPYGLPADPAPRFDDGEGTDFAALRAGCISVSLLPAGAADEASSARRDWFRATFAEPSVGAAASTSGAR